MGKEAGTKVTTDEVVAFLAAVAQRPTIPSLDEVRAAMAKYKRDALDRGDQDGAKRLWCLETALLAQEQYLAAFGHLKERAFYKAWCELEIAEQTLANLERHEKISWHAFRLDFLQTYTTKWQSLFPYRMFYSPEILKKETVCSICQRPVLPQAFCGHRVGQIYNGDLCHRIIKKAEVLGISMVDKPAQKYSVLFLSDKKGGITDQYDYALVEFAISALRGPFDEWDVERTTRRQPHARYAHVGRNDPCPCQSGKKYKHCCLREAGVLRPHFQFTFSKQPPDAVVLEERFID